MNARTQIKAVLLLAGACSGLIAPSALAQDGVSYTGTLLKVTAQISTFCASSERERTTIDPAPASVRGFVACNGSSVEINVTGGFPATMPPAQLVKDGARYQFIFSGGIPTVAASRTVLTTSDVPPQNKGGFVAITVPSEDNPDSANSKEYGGRCADLGTQLAPFQGTQDRSLTQSGCQRRTKWTSINTKNVAGTVVPDLFYVTTYVDGGITDSRLPRVHIELNAVYQMDVDCNVTVKGARAATAPACTPDLAIGDIVAVQSVQRLDLGNPLPLVPGKATLVRVFVESRGENAKILTDVSGTLTYDDFTKPLLPLNDGLALANPRPDRDNVRHSLNFLLPQQWTQVPVLGLLATVKFKGPGEIDTGNNSRYVTIRFDPTLNENLIVDAFDFMFHRGRRAGMSRGHRPCRRNCPLCSPCQ